MPRISDLPAALASSLGKIEWFGLEEKKEDTIMLSIIRDAIRKVSAGYLSEPYIEAILKDFDANSKLTVAEDSPRMSMRNRAKPFPTCKKVAKNLLNKKSPAMTASATELLLESLHFKG